MNRYTYCYYCQAYDYTVGQQVRCTTCQSDIAELSQCGMLHYETAQRLQAQAAQRKQTEQQTVTTI